MLKILIAPSAFKGTMSPVTVARAIEAGLIESAIDCRIELTPLADGGDGTLECLHYALGGNFEQVDCQGPIGEVHTASWLQLPDCAVVELATCCGLGLIEPERKALSAHTFGLGEALLDCLKKGQNNIVVTLGGSASTDGGSGALRALGAKFFDENKSEVSLGGRHLGQIVSCDLSALQKIESLKIAVDVQNPLLGAIGAAKIFAPQKGADASAVQQLEMGLSRFADVLESSTGKHMRDVPGVGAAGGTAFGLAVALNAQLISGFHWLSQLLDLERKTQWADLVISAEGKLDRQSLSGKASGELAALCKNACKKLIVAAAVIDNDCNWRASGITEVIDLGGSSKQLAAKDIQEHIAQFMRSTY
ncbi:MAG: glycerate kinase [Candidatus Obscuribacterales bacterium]|nr:glycerate kinase [Candidatus Obscuribacterales bacterium]